MGKVNVTLARSLAGSFTAMPARHSIIPCSMGCHLPFPTCLGVLSVQQMIPSPSGDSLVQNIPSSIFVIFASLNHLSPDVSDGYPRMIIQLGPPDIGPFVFTVAPGRENI